MGFGTLFIGYFLLLNVTYFVYTDLISALVILMGLYKLSSVNSSFKIASYLAGAFSLFGLTELGITVYALFSPTFPLELVGSYITPLRYVVIAFMTFYILSGIRDVSEEVGLRKLMIKAKTYTPVCTAIILIAAIFDIPLLGDFIPDIALQVIAIFILLLLFILLCVNLSMIYSAYMKICMPEDRKEKEEKKSKLGFVNKFREHEEEKRREYAEYKLEKLRKKNQKKRK